MGHTRARTRVHTPAHIHTVHRLAHVHTRTHSCVYSRMHTHTHAHTHTRTRTAQWWWGRRGHRDGALTRAVASRTALSWALTCPRWAGPGTPSTPAERAAPTSPCHQRGRGHFRGVRALAQGHQPVGSAARVWPQPVGLGVCSAAAQPDPPGGLGTERGAGKLPASSAVRGGQGRPALTTTLTAPQPLSTHGDGELAPSEEPPAGAGRQPS